MIIKENGVTFATYPEGKIPTAIKEGHIDVNCLVCDLSTEERQRLIAEERTWPDIRCPNPKCEGMLHREYIGPPIKYMDGKAPVQPSQWFCSKCGLEGFAVWGRQ
jgi:hypothetical protein